VKADHLEILVEEPSMEAFLREFLPRLLAGPTTFQIYAYQGKDDLLAKLGARLRGYAAWLPPHWRIIAVVDCDDDDCGELKQRMEQAATDAGLRSRSAAGEQSWQVVTRIAIEELEAWYFGDWKAVCEQYPKVPAGIPRKAPFRNSDAIAGGTWESLERILQRAGYFAGGLRKIELARALGMKADPNLNASKSFTAFRDALLEAVA
jgi:hypothetical protein